MWRCVLTILNLSVEWPSLERISSSSCTFVTIVQFCVQYTVPNFLRNFGNGKFKEQPRLTQKIQWSRVRIRHLSPCMNKTLRTGRVTVSNVKSRGREGNLHLRQTGRTFFWSGNVNPHTLSSGSGFRILGQGAKKLNENLVLQ